MRHSLSRPPAAPSGRGSPPEPAAARSRPLEGGGGGGSGSSAETGDEAEPAASGGGGGDEEELLFPGLELDEWLEAAVGRSDWARLSPPPPAGLACEGRAGSSRLKAAAAARLNRQRKKQYVQGLESRLQGLAAENRQLRDRNRGLCRRLRDLERETGYLRAVLANQSALGRLLGRLAGLRVGGSLWAATPGAEGGGGGGDHDYALPVPRDDGEDEEEDDDDRGRPAPSPAGLCLHVDRDRVSVEFCSVCSRRAAAGTARALAPAAPGPPPPSFAAKIFFFRCLPCQAPLCRG